MLNSEGVCHNWNRYTRVIYDYSDTCQAGFPLNQWVLNLKRAVSRSKAAQLAELTSNLAILGLTVSVILDCDPKSLNSL